MKALNPRGDVADRRFVIPWGRSWVRCPCLLVNDASSPCIRNEVRTIGEVQAGEQARDMAFHCGDLYGEHFCDLGVRPSLGYKFQDARHLGGQSLGGTRPPSDARLKADVIVGLNWLPSVARGRMAQLCGRLFIRVTNKVLERLPLHPPVAQETNGGKCSTRYKVQGFFRGQSQFSLYGRKG